jgi:hypothetical protein
MTEYICSGCEYTSYRKECVFKHINVRSNKCWTDEVPKIIEKEGKISCKFCKKLFKSRTALIRHTKNICEIKNNIDKEAEETNKRNQLKEELREEIMEELKEEIMIKKLEMGSNNTANITNIANTSNTANINNITNNNIIFQITPYNDPNLEDFERYYLHAIARIAMSVPTLIKHIHFNKNKTENHNILINNYRTKIAKVYDGHEWKIKDEDELLEELIDKYEKILEDWADGDSEKMIHLDKYIEIKDRDGIENVHNMLKEEIKKLVYDKRYLVNDTIKNQKRITGH